MESIQATTEIDALRLSDWIEATGLSRSTAYELLKLLQIEPEARRVPTSRKPVSHLTADQISELNPWAKQLAGGATLPQIRDRLEQFEKVHDTPPEQSQIVQVDQNAALLVAAFEKLQEVAKPEPVTDPLRCARALAEAADLGVPLSSAELAGVVGMAKSTVEGWSDGKSPRPGFNLKKVKQGTSTWWMVERPGRNHTIPADLRAIQGSGRSVGFAQVLDVQAIALPFI